MHGPAWQSFVSDSLKVEDSRQSHIKRMIRLFKDMTSASNMQVHTRISKLLRSEDCDDQDMVRRHSEDESGAEGGSPDIYGLSDGEDMAVQDTETIEEVAQDTIKPSNVMERPAGQNKHLQRKIATPPETPAAMPVSRTSTNQIINGEIRVVPTKKKAAKMPQALSESPAKVGAKPAACGRSRTSTQNPFSSTESTGHASVDKDNEEPRATRRRM